MLRLSTILYVDSTKKYDLSQENILIKIIESIFIGNYNEQLSASDITNLIREDYKMNFEDDNIISIIVINNNFDSSNIKNFSEINKKYALFKLNNEYYIELCRKAKPNYLDIVIANIFKENHEKVEFKGHTKQSIEVIIYKFLYNLFAKNFECYNSLILEKNRLDNDFLNELSSTTTLDIYKKDEIAIINEFLEYDDPRKNKMIFDIATLAFEYCTTISCNQSCSSNNIDYLEKSFYLDANILYRILGINGTDRKHKTITFINKCKDNGQKLFITDTTIKEFNESINYNCDSLLKYSENANPELYEIMGQHELSKHYFHLKKNNNITPDQYKTRMIKEIESYIETNQITTVNTIELNSSDHRKNINNLKTSLVEDTADSLYPKNDSNASYDAWNYYYLYTINNDTMALSKDNKHQFITTDDQLINWERRLPFVFKKICIKPSEWLTFLLRYISTTSDDFESFVSFLKLNYRRDSQLNEKSIAIIMNAVADYPLDIDEKIDILNSSLHTNFNKIKELQSSNDYNGIKDIIEVNSINYINEKHKVEKAELNKEIFKKNTAIEDIEKEKDVIEKEKKELKNQIDNFQSEKISSDNRLKELESSIKKIEDNYLVIKEFKSNRNSLVFRISILLLLFLTLYITLRPLFIKSFDIKNDTIGSEIIIGVLLLLIASVGTYIWKLIIPKYNCTIDLYKKRKNINS